jgi:glutathione-regulated potassium-efflux system protein KefB
VFDRRDMLALKKVGLAGQGVREVMESAVKMGRMALDSVGVEEEEIDRIEADYRERDLRRLRAQHEANDIRTVDARELMYRPGHTPSALDDRAEA